MSSSALLPDNLASGTVGKYNGVILTDSSALGLVSAGSCNGSYEPKMAAAEWDALHDYESTFGVRESVVSGSLWPWISGYPLEYGMDATAGFIKSVGAVTGNWLTPAGGKEVFEYIKNANPLPLDGGFAWVGKPRVQGTVPSAAAPVVVQPLLAVRNGSGAADKNQTLISIVRYAADTLNGRPNVREVLVSSISNAIPDYASRLAGVA